MKNIRTVSAPIMALIPISHLSTKAGSRRVGAIITIVLMAMGFCSCATTTSNMPIIPLVPAVQVGVAPPLPPYKVQVGDLLGLRFQTNPELNEDVIVRPDGLISTTVTEDVPAFNHTPTEISAELRDRYRSTLKDPHVTVIVRSFAPNRIYVAGEVSNPGEFVTVGPNLTVSQAIARAGGVKLSAARAQIFVLRRGLDDKPQAFKVDYLDVISGKHPEADARLAQYDVLYVPRTGIYEVYAFWNQFVQQFMPVSWGFSYNANPVVSVAH